LIRGGVDNVITIADVAKRAGVSRTTVSHALSGRRPVAPETRKRIEHVVLELGFRPNALARSLRLQSTQMVALIIPDITNPHYPMMARGLQDALVEHSYNTFICNTDNDEQQEKEFIADAIQRQVDGIVISSLHFKAQALQEYIEKGIIFLSIGPAIDDPRVDQVITSSREGAKAATLHLIKHGHQRIGMIGGVPDLIPGEARLLGYREALEEMQIPFEPDLVVEGNFVQSGGKQAMHKLLALPQRPTAVFCANDLMAIGALEVAREAGLAIPHDLALVGYDDIESASLVSPALTTVVNPGYEMGQSGGKLLLERMKGQYEGPGRRVVVPHRLIQRASV
jgi:LacI family transcriptional regulator